VALLLKSGEQKKERKDFFTLQPKMPAAAEKNFSRGNHPFFSLSFPPHTFFRFCCVEF
jgi:hypothetical protein